MITIPSFDFVGGSVGSGKTYWSILLMLTEVLQNYIYVCPTIELSRQVVNRISKHNINNQKKVVRIDSDIESIIVNVN